MGPHFEGKVTILKRKVNVQPPYFRDELLFKVQGGTVCELSVIKWDPVGVGRSNLMR